jgi:hypothetical protein
MRKRAAIVGAVLGMLCGVVTHGQPALAADPTPCPSGPTVDYTGTDDAAQQVHAERGELAASCSAVTDRLDALKAQLGGQLSVSIDGAHAVDCSNCAGAAATSGTDTDPTYVRLASSDVTNANLAQATTITHGDLWVLIGVLVGVQVLIFVLQKVWP